MIHDRFGVSTILDLREERDPSSRGRPDRLKRCEASLSAVRLLRFNSARRAAVQPVYHTLQPVQCIHMFVCLRVSMLAWLPCI